MSLEKSKSKGAFDLEAEKDSPSNLLDDDNSQSEGE